MEEPASENRDEGLNVPWPDVVGFVRQFSHDLRNHLNAADLTAAYINEIATDAELKAEMKRLRETIAAAAGALQKLSASVGRPRVSPIAYRVSEFIEDLRSKIAKEFPEQNAAIEWKIDQTEATLSADPQSLEQAFLELFGNAFRHNRGQGPVVASGKIDNQQFAFTLSEPKTSFALSTENWGREPLRTVGPGHYGLGLHRARAIIGAHGGELHARYEPGQAVLVTTITLPLAP
jgi:signal transduction histidine kinase